jgi:hypothetical protein
LVDTPEEVAEIVARELAAIADPVVREALRVRLRPPERHLRDWDYGADGQQFPCWTVVSDPASDTAIVYSQHGFGPESPWGLVPLSRLWFGMDSGWFLRLEDAFVESHLASDLQIWDVVTRNDRQEVQVVASSLAFRPAFAKRDELQERNPESIFHVVYRSLPDGGVP